jgi:hypothetical protein
LVAARAAAGQKDVEDASAAPKAGEPAGFSAPEGNDDDTATDEATKDGDESDNPAALQAGTPAAR